MATTDQAAVDAAVLLSLRAVQGDDEGGAYAAQIEALEWRLGLQRDRPPAPGVLEALDAERAPEPVPPEVATPGRRAVIVAALRAVDHLLEHSPGDVRLVMRRAELESRLAQHDAHHQE